MQQRASGKRRTGFMHADATPKALRFAKLKRRAPQPVRQPGTVKAQLLGKLGPRGYQKLVGALREITEQ